MTTRLKPARVAALFDRLKTARPDPKTELAYRNPFTLLVAVALSAQATDKSVNAATGPLFDVADTPEKMLALGEAGLKERIKTIGLYNTKAKNVIALSRRLIEDHGGRVPAERAALEALPGVGRKTANVVLAEAFGAKTLAVDTHVFRVARRTGLSDGKTPLAVETDLMAAVPERFLPSAHHWLILHGRYVCTAGAPKCGACPIADLCLFEEKAGVAVKEGAAGHKPKPAPAKARPSAPRRPRRPAPKGTAP